MLCLWLSGDTCVGTYSGMLTTNLPPSQEDSSGGLFLQLAFCRPHPPFLASNYTDVTVKLLVLEVSLFLESYTKHVVHICMHMHKALKV